MDNEPYLKVAVETDISKVPAILDAVHNMFVQKTKLGKKRDLMFTIELVVAEACTNVIRHSYPKGEKGILELEINVDEDAVHIEIADFGQSFDPSSLPEPDPDNPKTGGYGVFIIKNSMDTFAYESKNGRNALRLSKKLKE